nr:D-alanyl-D-alanine carboxypeptidase family protein [Natranaerofaba carboxydovora]
MSADGAALLELDSGRIIYVKNPDKELPMASTTKVMTGLLALENEELDSKVTASKEASEVVGSSIYLQEDEELLMEEMLYGLILESGNDAAHAIAEHIAGDIQNFNRLMNEKARELGATSTKFQNPHGLPAKNHFTTAKDLLKITEEALTDPVFSRVVATKRKIIPGPDEEVRFRFLRNTNKLFGKYPGTDGVKTGWTEKAGRCLVFSASKDGTRLVGTLLNAPKMYEDASKILDWGFSEYNQVTLFEEGQHIEELQVDGNEKEKVRLITKDKVTLPLREREKSKISYILKPKENIEAPIYTEDYIGNLEVTIDGQKVSEVKLVAENDIEVKGFWNRILSFFGR